MGYYYDDYEEEHYASITVPMHEMRRVGVMK